MHVTVNVGLFMCFIVLHRWAREFVEALNEDKRIKAEEHETRRERDLEKVKVVTEK